MDKLGDILAETEELAEEEGDTDDEMLVLGDSDSETDGDRLIDRLGDRDGVELGERDIDKEGVALGDKLGDPNPSSNIYDPSC